MLMYFLIVTVLGGDIRWTRHWCYWHLQWNIGPSAGKNKRILQWSIR